MSEAPANTVPKDLERLLDEVGAKVSSSRPIDYGVQYRINCGTDTAILNIYTSGKVSAGGKPSPLLLLLEDWRLTRKNMGGKRALKSAGLAEPDGTPRVGIDEAGKGDYFGPLVVAGVRVLGEEVDRKLREIGARDSKTLSVYAATSLAQRITESVNPENIRIVVLRPEEYESRRRAAGNNVNKVLAEVNVQVLDELKTGAELLIVDEFGKGAQSYIEPKIPPGIRLAVRPGAEDDVAVAAASILARARYLGEMDTLSEELGFELPRGATHVTEAARRVVRERGIEGLQKVAKVHFGTTARVLKRTVEDGG
ncbi:MAG: ribonuclease HIII [Actinomycetota bacterium]|nr:ribonuclease HIII [Actinomycetota bacterium]